MKQPRVVRALNHKPRLLYIESELRPQDVFYDLSRTQPNIIAAQSGYF